MNTQEQAAFDLMREALKLAIRQNSFDMLMTGEELRKCEFALAAAKAVQPQAQEASELEAFNAWFMERKRKTFPKDYDISRLAGWAEHYRPEAWGGWQARAATEPAKWKRYSLDLDQYVNSANISANDKPVAVIEKLQAVINERNAHHE